MGLVVPGCLMEIYQMSMMIDLERYVLYGDLNMSHVMRKPAFCICENKGADLLHGNCAADHIDSTMPLLP